MSQEKGERRQTESDGSVGKSRRFILPGRWKQPARPRGFNEKFRQKGSFGTDIPYRKRFRAFYRLYRLEALLGLILILSGAVVGLSFTWHVTDILVEGTNRYRAEELLEASGIQPDDLMLGFTASDTEKLLLEKFPLLASVRISRSLSGTVVVTVREEDKLYYTCHYRNYYLLSAETMRVLAVDASANAWSSYSPVYIGMPEEARVRVGETVTFSFLPYPAERDEGNVSTYEVETGTASEEFAYVTEARDIIMNSQLASHVTGMELSDRYDLWFLLDGKIKVRLGDTSRLEDKLSLVTAVLARHAEPDGTALLDASDPAAVTFREDPDITLPDWAV